MGSTGIGIVGESIERGLDEALLALQWLLARHRRPAHLSVILRVPAQTIAGWAYGKNVPDAAGRSLVVLVAELLGWKGPQPPRSRKVNPQPPSNKPLTN